jgi:hypothetical protein
MRVSCFCGKYQYIPMSPLGEDSWALHFRFELTYLLSCEGKREIRFSAGEALPTSYQYIGADDRAGANYTKQEVVDSYYRYHNLTI